MIDGHMIESSETESETEADSNRQMQAELAKWVSDFNITQNTADIFSQVTEKIWTS